MDIFLLMQKSKMFENLGQIELRAVNFCFKTSVIQAKKGDVLVENEQNLDSVILILEGSAKTCYMDLRGNENIIKVYNQGEVYGLEEAFLNLPKFRYSLVATSDCTLLMINRYRLTKMCENGCARHQKIINNCIYMVAQNSNQLLQKLNEVTRRSTKDKILTFLQNESHKQKSTYFDIVYDRQELADYLAVDRSALSNELAKLKKEGVIDFNKNHFRLFLENNTYDK